MESIKLPRYLERNLCDILREYVERKIIFDCQDIIITNIYMNKKSRAKQSRKYKFTKKAIENLYKRYGKTVLEKIKFDIPIQESLAKTIKNSFEKSDNFFKSTFQKLNNDENFCKYWRRNPQTIIFHPDFKREMEDNGYRLYVGFEQLLQIRIFEHEIDITTPFILCTSKSNKYFLRINVYFSI